VGDIAMSVKPIAAASGLASGVWAVFEFGLLNLDAFLGVLVPLAYRIAPRVPWLPEDALNYAVFVLTVAFVAFGLARLAGRAMERFA